MVGTGVSVAVTVATGVAVGVSVVDVVGALVALVAGRIVITFLQASPVGEKTLSLSRTRHDAPSEPIVLYVCATLMDPGLPTFFSTVWDVPSPNINSAAMIRPPGSTPAQVNVTLCGVPLAVVISEVRLAQYGEELLGVGVGVWVGVWVGVFVPVCADT